MAFGVPSSLSCSKEQVGAAARVHSARQLTMINVRKAHFTHKPQSFPFPPSPAPISIGLAKEVDVFG